MTKKVKPRDGSRDLRLKLRSGQRVESRIAEIEMQGLAANARVAVAFGEPFSAVPWSLTDCAIELKRIGDAVVGGDVSDCERLLAAQVAALNWVFVAYAQRAAASVDRNVGDSETFLRQALRAQAQCRVTVETLHNMKHPRQVAFVSQTNMGQNVQVNNGPAVTTADVPVRSGKAEFRDNKLLEANDGARVEPGTTGQAGRSDSTVVPLAAVNRAAKR